MVKGNAFGKTFGYYSEKLMGPEFGRAVAKIFDEGRTRDREKEKEFHGKCVF